MLHLGAICCCPDLSGKSTHHPNTALSLCIQMVPIYMDCICPQREARSIEDQQQQWSHWPCASYREAHCSTLRSPQNCPLNSCPLQMEKRKTDFPRELTSSHLISYWLVFVGWRKCFLLEQGKEEREKNQIALFILTFWDGFWCFLNECDYQLLAKISFKIHEWD